jgi:UDP-N-acetylmuramoyl-tripeptide--D-alanyl-D-alanine ligase
MTIFNDCYNANPGSMNNGLDMLASCDWCKGRRRVFICGDMGELGHHAEHFHRQLGQSVAKTPIKLLITVGKFSKVAADAAKKTADNNLQIKSFDDTISLCNMLKDLIKDSDIILVKGSRAAGLEIVVEKLKELFETKMPAGPKSSV